MIAGAFGRSALTICLVVAMLPLGAAARPPRSVPWAFSAAHRSSLLYVGTGDNVYMLSYPAGVIIGALNVPGYDICSDPEGNVFVPRTAIDEVSEYAHGFPSPRATLHVDDQPLGCAVDPVTRNLAVTLEGSGASGVAVFPNAKEPAQYYDDTAVYQYGLCGYDGAGNLFVDGTGTGNVLAELPKGASTFENFALNGDFDPFGSVEWDGRFMTLTNPSTKKIYRIQLLKSRVKIAGTTALRGWHDAYSGHWPYVQTWLRDDTFFAQGTSNGAIGLWRYPVGGSPRQSIGGFDRATTIYGVTFSAAPIER
ncbi:MAG: hypothetical protein JO060_06980 [Candidatus Eremiobacteraeota bacterium]|nr:hypothetical protein [Candidatus Eremiobacteraeota bacterium]